eukprot:3342696-Rhodomonas_salina.2
MTVAAEVASPISRGPAPGDSPAEAKKKAAANPLESAENSTPDSLQRTPENGDANATSAANTKKKTTPVLANLPPPASVSDVPPADARDTQKPLPVKRKLSALSLNHTVSKASGASNEESPAVSNASPASGTDANGGPPDGPACTSG